jgi:hypothetical protein
MKKHLILIIILKEKKNIFLSFCFLNNFLVLTLNFVWNTVQMDIYKTKIMFFYRFNIVMLKLNFLKNNILIYLKINILKNICYCSTKYP